MRAFRRPAPVARVLMHADAVHGQCDINEMFEEFTGELLVHRSFSCTAALAKRAGDEPIARQYRLKLF